MSLPQFLIFPLALLILLNCYRSAIAIWGLVGSAVNFVNPSDHRYNFLVAIEKKTNRAIVCTGSLISKRHVLSAEHCMEKEVKKNLQVIVGPYNRIHGTKYDIIDWKGFRNWAHDVKHPDTFFGPQDIAIYVLSDVVTDQNIHYMPFTTKPQQHFYGKSASILGWGETLSGKPTASLQISHLTILTPRQCEANVKNYFGKTFHLVPERFCSNSSHNVILGGGDSGGPMIYDNEIIGIAESAYPIVEESEYHEHQQNFHTVLESHHLEFIKKYSSNC